MYTGTIVPLITPLDHAGAVSPACVARLVDSLSGAVSALMPALSSGEGFALTDRQWDDVVTATVAHSAGLPVLAGIQLPDTAAVVRRAEQARAARVDAIVVTAPFGEHLTQDMIFEHFATVREAVEVPLFVYNEAAVSGNHLELDTLVRVCRLPGVVGLKESSGSPELTAAIAAAVPEVPVFEGWEHLLADARGVAGFIGPLANLEPGLCNAMLVKPSGELQAEINDACTRYGLLAEDWYHLVKTELVARGVIDTDRVVGHHEVAAP